jgi:RNA polymerase sigma-70 factor (ECF subfamily)
MRAVNPGSAAGRSSPVWVVSDDALLDGLATGDPDAAAAFVERFQRRVFGVAVRIVGDSSLAEDVAQETFVRAWQRAGAFDPRRGTVVSWLLAIARNLAIDTVRLRRIVIVDPDELLARRDPVGDRGPADLALLGSETERLRVAIRRLPKEQSRALVLAAFFGHTAQEIADSEEIPLGTAKTRIRTAMIRLRAAMVDDAEGTE